MLLNILGRQSLPWLENVIAVLVFGSIQNPPIARPCSVACFTTSAMAARKSKSIGIKEKRGLLYPLSLVSLQLRNQPEPADSVPCRTYSSASLLQSGSYTHRNRQ